MTERVKGMTLEEAGKIRNQDIAKELSLPPVKLHCSSEYQLHHRQELQRQTKFIMRPQCWLKMPSRPPSGTSTPSRRLAWPTLAPLTCMLQVFLTGQI